MSAATSRRPLILLSNDDGVGSPGIEAVRAALAAFADVVICAPLTNQSATSHSLTLHRPLRLTNPGPGVFAVDGTPADCVYVALGSGARVVPRFPDLCVSGLNHGLNLGVDTFYSGTVAAAREAALRGIPSIALSADTRADIAEAAAIGAALVRALLDRARTGEAEERAADSIGRHAAELYNVNFPPGSGWDVRPTTLGLRFYAAEVEFRNDQRGGEYLWIGGANPRHGEAPGSDTDAYDSGAVGVSQLSLDQSFGGVTAAAMLVERSRELRRPADVPAEKRTE
jgi:5'-nucleotidase